MSRTSARASSGLRPIVAARDVQRVRCWQSLFRLAMDETGHKVSSVACALGVSDQAVRELLDPRERRSLTDGMLARLRAHPDTRELARWFEWFRGEQQLPLERSA